MDKFFRNLFLFLALFAFVACGPTMAKRKDESQIHYKMGIVHFNEKNYTESLKELTTAIAKYPEEASYHNAIGLVYFQKGMNTEAIASMKKAIALDPKSSEAHVNLSAIYIVERRWDDVIFESREALKNIFYRTPEYAYFNMGWAHYNKSNYREAVESYRKAVDLNPNYALAYYNMGIALEKMNSTKESVAAYERAIKASPAFIDAHYNLGVALVKQKDKAGALRAFEKVLEISPEGEKAQSARDYINLIK